MLNADFMIFYVDSPEASGRFYARLIGREPREASPAFVLFALESGVKLRLWSRHTVEPAATSSGGDAELVFTVDDAAAVDATFADWKRRGVRILQEPVAMDFGRTFTALDPDGHRLRVFCPSEG